MRLGKENRMETIRNYIDNLFRSYPHTPKVQKARAELLEIMEDKYNELKSQGVGGCPVSRGSGLQ